MPMTPDDPSDHSPLDFERLLDDGVDRILEDEDPDRFLDWIRSAMGNYLVEPDSNDLASPDALGRVATLIGRSIWNATPLPGNNLRPRPIAEPGRNDPCICGSGRKYKRCCATEPQFPPIEVEMMLAMVLDKLPEAALQAQLDTGRAPIEAIVAAANHHFEGGKPRKATALLEPIFQATIRQPRDIHDVALNLLCDVYDDLGFERKKARLLRHVIDTADKSPLRSGAWQRIAAIRIDNADHSGAWEAFRNAQRDDPDNTGNALLEVQMLMSERRSDEARGRAAYWEKRMRRSGHDDSPAFDFIARVARDPDTAMRELGLELSDGAGSSLIEWINTVRQRPVPAYRAVPEEQAPERSGTDIRHRLQSLGIPQDQVEEMLASLEQQAAEAADEAGDGGEDENDGYDPEPSLILVVPPAIVETEAKWQEVVPISKPFSTQDEPLGEDGPTWETAVEAEWMKFLHQHPEAFDSIDILDDLATMVIQHDQFGIEWVDRDLLGPLLQRSEGILEQAVGAVPQPRLAWRYMDNRPALRTLFRLFQLHDRRGDKASSIQAAERLLDLNPDDNHGLRTVIVNHLLRLGDDHAALELTDCYPNDLHADISYGRVLALYRLGRPTAAADALRAAKTGLPKIPHYLLRNRVKRPKLDGTGFTLGGDDQAWFYRVEMRDVWLDSPGALEWLERAVKWR